MSATRPPSSRERTRFLQQRELRHRPVAGYHDLPARHVESVEGVEEALLGLLLADDELDVVQEQHVD